MLTIDDLHVVAQVLKAGLIDLANEKDASLQAWQRITGFSLKHQRSQDFEAGWNAALCTLGSKVQDLYDRCEGGPRPN